MCQTLNKIATVQSKNTSLSDQELELHQVSWSLPMFLKKIIKSSNIGLIKKYTVNQAMT